MDSFRVVPIPQAVADRIRETRKDGHGNTGIEPTRADAPRGFPCRVCLEEAKVGEEVLLFSYSPFERPVPYRSVGPVFVHARSCAPYGPRASVPELMRSRLISLRAYDSRDRMVECDVVDGAALEAMVARFFANPEVACIHAHNARAGCFVCRIERTAEKA